MKKIIILLSILSIIYISTNYKEEIFIPENSIRFRIIANSNSLKDQALKMNIKDELLSDLNYSNKNINDARKDIIDSIPKLENKLNTYNIKYSINYGNNYFPEKEYKGITYDSGNYESLVITLGNGLGENYWCVLYPPLCLIEDNNNDNIEYKLLIKDILNKYN